MENSTINPICAACKEKIGEMPLDIYMKAIEYRGPFLFCPECRTHKCDCCGWYIPTQIMAAVTDEDGKFIGNACETCFQFVLWDNPSGKDFTHFLTTAKPNLKHINFHGEAAQ